MRARLRPPVATDLISRLPDTGPVAVVRDGPRTVIGVDPSAVVEASGRGSFDAIDGLTGGWWAGMIAYDVGRAIERVSDKNPRDLPFDISFVGFETRIVCDGQGVIEVEGRRDTLDELLSAKPRRPVRRRVSNWTSSFDRVEYGRAVAAVHEHLLAGNCYQINLTRTLSTESELDPRHLFLDLRRANPAPHEAFVRTHDIAVVSASPESFLRVDGRTLTTRPIKGTSSDPGWLQASAKDRAENIMIVDLARNDLGRVCEYGSVGVRELCALERHPGLYHLVSTIEGRLRDQVTLGDLIRATFPPASVTGCPKPRVLQIIEELEPVRRGVYCGAIGFIDADRGVCDFNVAIRTFTIGRGKTTFGVGGGIVADSRAEAEWAETELKARRLLRIASGA